MQQKSLFAVLIDNLITSFRLGMIPDGRMPRKELEAGVREGSDVLSQNVGGEEAERGSIQVPCVLVQGW